MTPTRVSYRSKSWLQALLRVLLGDEQEIETPRQDREEARTARVRALERTARLTDGIADEVDRAWGEIGGDPAAEAAATEALSQMGKCAPKDAPSEGRRGTPSTNPAAHPRRRADD